MFKKGNNKHDVKQNIRANSIFANVKADIRILYFILFENFIYNFSINTVYNNCKEFSRDIGIKFISRNYLGNIYRMIRGKIRDKKHNFWNSNNMAEVPCLDGKSKIEIDESKFITYDGYSDWWTELNMILGFFMLMIIGKRKHYCLLLNKMYILFLIDYIIMKMEII